MGATAKKKRTVLLVDDSTVLLGSLEAAFSQAGYEVGHAVDGEEVFRKLTALAPDALLLDVYMPKINGADVCRLIKAHPSWKGVYLVLMSARVNDREIETYRRLGADNFLKKPFAPQDAVAMIDRALEARPQSR